MLKAGQPKTQELSLLPLDADSVGADRRLSMVTESYRKLRTAIFYSQADQPPKTLLVTSATTKEGKTMTAVNTAIVLAQAGLKVLLIDADLRRPSCDQILDVWATEGLSDYLVGHEELDKMITRRAGAQSVASHPRAPSAQSTELLTRKRCAKPWRSSNTATILS